MRDSASAYSERNSEPAYRIALDELNAPLDLKSERVRAVQLEVPDSTGIYSEPEPLALNRLSLDVASEARPTKPVQ